MRLYLWRNWGRHCRFGLPETQSCHAVAVLQQKVARMEILA